MQIAPSLRPFRQSPSPRLLPSFPAAHVAVAIALFVPLYAQGTSTDWVHPDGTTHAYRAVAVPGGVTWNEAHEAAARAGGYLATATSDAENSVIHGLLQSAAFWVVDDNGVYEGPWLGGVQSSGGREPDGGWGWANLESLTFRRWSPGQPDDNQGADRLHYGGSNNLTAGTWADAPGSARMPGYVIEFSGAHARRTVGLLKDEPGAFSGYTLLSPGTHRTSYLIDTRGRVVHSWASAFFPGQSSYLLPNGNLLRTAALGNVIAPGGGAGGLVEEFDWNGNLVWRFALSTPTAMLHHDIERLPNGNTLMIVWEMKTGAEATAAGRDPAKMSQGVVWLDKIIEVQPTGPNSGTVVWEWSVWDHLIQDHDPKQLNYGDPAAHPERVDLNYAPETIGDWMHTNAISYNPQLDQIILSVRSFEEFWIIDHSTTSGEAAGSTGGRSGKGGDLLYRWGNPLAYRAGTVQDRRLYLQHDVQWIPLGLQGAGHVLVFNNGTDRPLGAASGADEIVLPQVDSRGNYPRSGPAWGPLDLTWSYLDANPTSFYSPFVGGVQRLPNGNTMVVAGWHGRAREVDSRGNTVWEYVNPVKVGVATHQGESAVDLVSYTFRAPRYPLDYAAFTNRVLIPGEPLELHRTVLLADGSTVDRYAPVGTDVTFTLRAQGVGSMDYVLATSATAGLIPIDTRLASLGFDPLLQTSALGRAPTVFRGYRGTLDAAGLGRATLSLPPIPELAGLDLRTVMLVVDPAAPSSFAEVSNTVVVHVTL